MLPPETEEHKRQHRRIGQKQKFKQRHHSQNILVPSGDILPIRVDNRLTVHGTGTELKQQFQSGKEAVAGSIVHHFRLLLLRSQLFPNKIHGKIGNRVRHNDFIMINSVA